MQFIIDYCKSLPHTTEDIKWSNDLCFSIGGKMYCVLDLNAEFKVCIKVMGVEFEELCSINGIIPAPYMARNNWILITDSTVFKQKAWKKYILQSYEIIKSKLPKKVIASLG